MRRYPPILPVVILLGLFVIYKAITEFGYISLFYIVSVPSVILVIYAIVSSFIEKRMNKIQLKLYEKKFAIQKNMQKEIESQTKQEDLKDRIVSETIEKKTDEESVRYGKTSQAVNIPKSNAKKIKCEKCGADMVLKTAKQGVYKGNKFYGCSKFPKCKNIVPVYEQVAEKTLHKTSVKPALPKCPDCGIEMVLRTAKQGQNTGSQFYGCRNFPKCRNTISIK